MIAIVAQPGFERVRVDAMPPVVFDDLDIEAQLLGHLNPQGGELAEVEHQDLVAGRERVGERALPGAGAGGRIDDDFPGGLKNLFHPGEDFEPHAPELRPAVIDGGSRHGPQDALGDIGGTGKLNELAAAYIGHGYSRLYIQRRVAARAVWISGC